MEEAFLRRAERLLAKRAPAALEYDVLTAALAAARAAAPAATDTAGRPLAELLSGGAGWRDAVVRQGGSFSPAQGRSGGDTVE